MKKTLLLLAAVILSLSAFAEKAVFYVGTYTGSSNYSTELTGTVVGDPAPEYQAGNITIYFEKKNNNSSNVNGDVCRWYVNDILHVVPAAGTTITNVTILGTKKYPSNDATITSNPTGATLNTSNHSIVWTGSQAGEVTISCSKQVRFTAIEVTYTAGEAPAVSAPKIKCADNAVTITCDTEGAEIYYTLDGTTPSKSSEAYTAPFEITKNTTVKAIAYKGEDQSGVTTFNAVYVVQGEISVADAISLIDNDYTASAQVKGYIVSIKEVSTQYGNATYDIADEMNSSNTLTIYRGNWLNGAKFTSADQIEVGAEVVVEGDLTLYNGSHQMKAGNKILSYTAPQVEYVKTPVFNPESGMVEAGTEVTITCETEGASIYYTTDGTTPTVESTLYTAPIAVNSAMTITAIAAKEGMVNSEVASASYTLYNPNEKFVTFDFTDTTWLQNEGVEIPTTASTCTDVAGKSFTVVPVTFAIADNSETVQARIWKATSGTVHLRMYKSDSFTISSTENFKLMSVEFTPVSTSNFGLTLAEGSEGTLDNTTWNAPDSKTVESVKFGISKNSYINSVKVLYDVVSGVENIESEENVAPVYYNLQGVRVANPQNGLYIQVKGGKSSKVLVK